MESSAYTIESGSDHSLQLRQFLVPCALFFASIAGVCVQLHIDIPYSGISRVAVASYHRKHIWPRGKGISELKRFIHSLSAFHSQTQAQLSISRIHCYLYSTWHLSLISVHTGFLFSSSSLLETYLVLNEIARLHFRFSPCVLEKQKPDLLLVSCT